MPSSGRKRKKARVDKTHVHQCQEDSNPLASPFNTNSIPVPTSDSSDLMSSHREPPLAERGPSPLHTPGAPFSSSWPKYSPNYADVGDYGFKFAVHKFDSSVKDLPAHSTDADYLLQLIRIFVSGPFIGHSASASEILQSDVQLREKWTEVVRLYRQGQKEALRPIVNFLHNAEDGKTPVPTEVSEVFGSDVSGEYPDSSYEAAVDQAWAIEYSGSVELLALETIRMQSESLNADAKEKCEYGNSVAVVQSSGMGKSRMMHEMGKYVFIIPLNLREPDPDGHSYPPPDDAIRNYLTKKSDAPTLFEHKCRRLLSAIFSAAATFLERLGPNVDYCQKVHLWRLFLEKHRTEFYEQIVKHVTIHNQKGSGLVQSFEGLQARLRADSNYPQAECIRLEVFSVLDEASYFSELCIKAKECAQKAEEVLSKYGMQAVNHLEAVMYFDEAHELLRDPLSGLKVNLTPTIPPRSGRHTLISDVVPIHITPQSDGAVNKKLMYQRLLSVLNELVINPIHFVFLSTSWNILHFVSPQNLLPGAPAITRERLQPPIVELSFDCHPTLMHKIERNFDIVEISKMSYMARFGRPLFWAILEAAASPPWNYSPDFIKVNIMQLAMGKLAGAHFHTYPKSHAQLAVLDLRLCFDYGHRLLWDEAELVAMHMRVISSVPPHSSYFWSGYPSEPILAEAAAELMYIWSTPSAHPHADPNIDIHPWVPAEALSHWMDKGTISRGARGEVGGRLVVITPYDSAVRARPRDPRCDIVTTYSTSCTVKEWITHMFTDSAAVLGCKPINLPEPDVQDPNPRPPSKTFEEALGHGRVRILQFIKVLDGSGFTEHGLRAAFIRGYAYINTVNTKLVDVIVPIALPIDSEEKEFIMTAVLIQFKDLQYVTDTGVDYDHNDVGLFDDLEDRPDIVRPYCTIFMELGQHPGEDGLLVPETSRRLPNGSPYLFTRYGIHVRGCSSKVFNFIRPTEDAAYASLFNARTPVSDHARQGEKSIDQVKRLQGAGILEGRWMMSSDTVPPDDEVTNDEEMMPSGTVPSKKKRTKSPVHSESDPVPSNSHTVHIKTSKRKRKKNTAPSGSVPSNNKGKKSRNGAND